MTTLKTVDLFAGIGGFTVAGELAGGYETVAFCELNKNAQAVLRKHWPDVPIFDDVTKLKADDIDGTVDVITGGWPCQDVSTAGKMLGVIDGDRSSLFTEILRIAAEVRERQGRLPYLLMENVGNLIRGGNGLWFAAVMHGLASIGYDAEWHVLPASYVGASHRRERIWIIAYPSETGGERNIKKPIFWQRYVQGEPDGILARWTRRSDIPEPRTIRTNDGIPNYSHRISMMGNAIVPQVAACFLRAIKDDLKNR